MIKTVLLRMLLLSVCCFQQVFAQTNVSGILPGNTTWQLENSPFRLVGNVQIPAGVTLVIEPGVKVEYSGAFQIYVQGAIQGVGTKAAPIVFTSPTAGISSGATQIKFEGANLSLSALQHIRMEYAHLAIRMGEESDRSRPKNSGTLRVVQLDLHAAGIMVGGYQSGAKLVIDTATIVEGRMMAASEDETFEIHNAKITNSVLSFEKLERNSLYLVGCSVSNTWINTVWGGGKINLTGSFLRFCTTTCYSQTSLRINKSILIESPFDIIGNLITVDSSIIQYDGRKNFIYHPQTPESRSMPQYGMWTTQLKLFNSTVIGTGAGTGIDIKQPWNSAATTASVDISHSNIINNGTGIRNNAKHIHIENSTLLNNTLSSIANVSAYDQKMPRNYWGEYATSSIDATIADRSNDLQYGEVDYTGFRPVPHVNAPITPPVISKKEAVAGGIRLTWGYNYEPDHAGYRVHYGLKSPYVFDQATDVGNVHTHFFPGLTMADSVSVTAYDKDADGRNDQVEGHESWFGYYGRAKTVLPQQIAFQKVENKAYADRSFILVATATSGLPVSFRVTSGPAVIQNDTLTITGTGQVVVNAYQPGNAQYHPSESEQIFVVSKSAQSITFAALPDRVYDGASQVLRASANSGLPVVFQVVAGPAIIQGDSLKITGAGLITVKAYQAGNANYLSAESEQTFNVDKSPQRITFDPLTDQVYGSAARPLEARSSSGLPVTYRVVSGPARIETGWIVCTAAGKVQIEVTQRGDGNYLAAPAVKSQFCVLFPKPVVTIAEDDLLNRVSLTSNSPVGNQWSVDGREIPGAIYQAYNVTRAGSYSVSVTIDSCRNVADSDPVVLTAVQQNASRHGLRLYPNPAQDEIYITGEPLPARQSGWRLLLYNNTGALVLAKPFEAGKTVTALPTKGLAPGLYHVRITDFTKEYQLSFIKQ